MTDNMRQMTDRIESFRELKVYRAAFELQREIFEVTGSFPKGEAFSLTDQMRRSSRSIGANLAETQHWLDTALACNYIKPDCHQGLIEQCRQIGRMLGSMINKPSTFCRQSPK